MPWRGEDWWHNCKRGMAVKTDRDACVLCGKERPVEEDGQSPEVPKGKGVLGVQGKSTKKS
jgi:hypothetical protein